MKNYIFDDTVSPIFEKEYIPLLEIPFIYLFESYTSQEQLGAWEKFNELYIEEIRNNLFDVIDGKEEQPWEVLPFELVKRVWIEYAVNKLIRYERMEKKIDQMADLIIDNIVKLYVNTVLSGHTEQSVESAVEEAGYCFKKESTSQEEEEQEEQQEYDEIKEADPTLFPVQYVPKEYKLKPGDFDEDNQCEILSITEDEYQRKSEGYIFDENWHQWRISDYAMKPLLELANELLISTTAEEKIILMDRVFNIVHQRGDIASLFVKGGSYALSELADVENLVFV